MKGIIKLVKEKYFFILIPDTRQVFAHRSTWLSLTPPCIDDVVEFDLAPSIKPQYRDQAVNVRKISAFDVLADATEHAEVTR